MKKTQLIALAVLLTGCAQSAPDRASAWTPEPQPEPAATSVALVQPAEPAVFAEPLPGDTRNEAERLVLSQPPEWYAVQVFADPSEARLQRFAQQYQLSPRLHLRTELGGQTWHVLLLDTYPTLTEARKALEQVDRLPNYPWVRPLGGLQNLIR